MPINISRLEKAVKDYQTCLMKIQKGYRSLCYDYETCNKDKLGTTLLTAAYQNIDPMLDILNNDAHNLS